jgi:hypothetical protein
VHSQARGKTVDLFTAVPHGHGDGAGLPVCVILHGVSATPKNYQAFGLGKFLTAAVERAARPRSSSPVRTAACSTGSLTRPAATTPRR